MASQTFRVGWDRPIDPAAVDLGNMDRAEVTARDFTSTAIDLGPGAEALQDLDVRSVVDQVRTERTQLSRVMVAALAPLVLLTLLLLYALVSTAAQVRRPHVALAKLRGHSRTQVLRFALSEPFLVVAIAAPIGVAIAVAAAHVIARGWLHADIPVGVDAVTVVSLLLVVGAALVASAVAAAGGDPRAAVRRARRLGRGHGRRRGSHWCSAAPWWPSPSRPWATSWCPATSPASCSPC